MPPDAASSTANLRRTFLILTAAAAGMGALLAYLPAAGHDQLWLLYVARSMLAGARLYGPELLESNPPLIVWMSLAPAWLGHTLHVESAAVGKLIVVLFQAAVAAVSLRLLRRLFPALTGAQIAWLLFVFVVLFNVVPARDLGQRDYLLALFCVPYLLAAGWRASGAELPTMAAVEVGLLAGVGLALKPHEALVPVAVELYLLWQRRSARTLLRPEPLILLLTGAGYLLTVWRVTPDYFHVVLPLLRDTYWAVGSLTLAQLVWQAIELHGLILLTVWLWLKTPSRGGVPPVAAEVFLAAGFASTVAYYLQGTGWYYQQLPAICFFAAALALLTLPLAASEAARWVPRAALGLGGLALTLTTHFMHYPFTRDRSFAIDTPNPAFFTDLPPGTKVATLTTTVDYTVMPAAKYGFTIAQRYPHLWMLPAILRNEVPDASHPPKHVFAPQRLSELDQLQHTFMVQDLRHWQPELVLVERCHKADAHCQLLEDRNDNLLDWFMRDPAFAAEWQNYTYVGHHLHFDGYVRKGSGIEIH